MTASQTRSITSDAASPEGYGAAPRAAATRRRTARGVVGATLLPAALAACGQAGGVAPAASKQPITLNYASDVDGSTPEGKARLDLVQEFNKTNALNITVNTDQAKAASDIQKLKVLAAAGTPPDFTSMYFTQGPELYVAGATVELEGLLKKDKDWAKQKADLFPGILETAVWGGKLTSLPMYQNITAMVYDPQLLARAGLQPPAPGWTWNDFMAAAKRASDPPAAWGLSFKFNMGHYTTWVGGMGVNLISSDLRKMTLTTPECIEATTFVANLAKNGITSQTSNQELFRKGTHAAVFEIQGPFRMAVFRQAGIEFGVVHHPVHPNKKIVSAFGDGHDATIFKGVPVANQEAAARAMVWLNSPYAQGMTGAAAVGMPISKTGNQSKELAAYLRTDPQFKVFIDTAPNVRSPRFPALPSYDKLVVQTINPALADIYGQKIGVVDALTELQRLTQQILDEDLKTLK